MTLFSLLCRTDKSAPLVSKGQPRGPGNYFIWNLVSGGGCFQPRQPWSGPSCPPPGSRLPPVELLVLYCPLRSPHLLLRGGGGGGTGVPGRDLREVAPSVSV